MQTTGSPKTDSIPHAAEDWQRHEHTSSSIAAQAQRLVSQAGSAEIARQAIDSVGEELPTSAGNSDDDARSNFAKAMGFDTFVALRAASKPVESNDGKEWFLTALPDNTWGAWNATQLLSDRHFASREEALASVPHDAEFSGSATLG